MISPWEKRFGTKLDISDLHIFGSIVYVKWEKEPEKLGLQAQEGQWLDIEPESGRHWIYWIDQKTVTVE